MKISLFPSLTKEKLDIESIKSSNLVAVRHTIDQLPRGSGSFLEQYMNIQHNLLYKTWTCRPEKMKKKTVVKERTEWK
jgi:hypothetical protein